MLGKSHFYKIVLFLVMTNTQKFWTCKILPGTFLADHPDHPTPTLFLGISTHPLPARHYQHATSPPITHRHFPQKLGLAQNKSLHPSYTIKHCKYSRKRFSQRHCFCKIINTNSLLGTHFNLFVYCYKIIFFTRETLLIVLVKDCS